MTVWIVVSGRDIAGVYSSREKAEQAHPWYAQNGYEIHAHTVDPTEDERSQDRWAIGGDL